MTDATNCTEAIIAAIESVPGLENRVHHVYSEEELVERTKGLGLPYVGVVYDGIRSVGDDQRGISSQLVVSVFYFFKQNTMAVADPKLSAIQTIDAIRKKIIRTRSPSNHFWKFQMEVAVQGRKGVLAYVQRWATPVQLS